MSQKLRVVRDQREQAAAYLADHPNCGRRELAEAVGWGQGTARKFLEEQGAKGKRGPKPKTSKEVMSNSGENRHSRTPSQPDNAQPQLASAPAGANAGEAPGPSTLAVAFKPRASVSRRGEPALPKILPPRSALAASLKPSKGIAPGTGLVLQGIGWAMVPVAVWINAQTGWRFGTTEQSALAFACLSGIADALVIWLPRCATAAWLGRQRITSASMWVLLAVIYSLPVMASLGFADLHIADTAAARAAAVTTASELTVRRNSAIDAAKGASQAASRSRASECQVRGPRCRDLERTEQLRMTELEAALDAPVPVPAAIGDTDPQVAGAVRLATWIGVHLTSTDVGNLRLALIGLLPNLAGLVLAFGCALRRR